MRPTLLTRIVSTIPLVILLAELCSASTIPTQLLTEVEIGRSALPAFGLWDQSGPAVIWSDGDVRRSVLGQPLATFVSNASLGAVAVGADSTLYVYNDAQGLEAAIGARKPVLVSRTAPRIVRAVWTGNDFVVLWSGGVDLFGARISSDGRLTHGPDELAPNPGLQWIEISAASGNVLVLSRGYQHGISRTAAMLLTPEGPQAACAPPLGDFDTGASVTSDGTSFLVTWWHLPLDANPFEPPGPGEYTAQWRINASGGCAASERWQFDGSRGAPRLFWTGDEYLRVWSESTPPFHSEIFAMRMTSNGILIPESLTHIGAFEGSLASVARSASGQLLLVYTRWDVSNTYVFARYVTFARRAAAHR